MSSWSHFDVFLAEKLSSNGKQISLDSGDTNYRLVLYLNG